MQLRRQRSRMRGVQVASVDDERWVPARWPADRAGTPRRHGRMRQSVPPRRCEVVHDAMRQQRNPNGCRATQYLSDVHCGSRPMKPSSLVWASASSLTGTLGPYWPDDRMTSSSGSMPESSMAEKSGSRRSS